MNTLRFTTFNIFWFGTPESQKIRRSAEDDAMLVKVLRRVDADAFVFQEVVNLPQLEELLARAQAGTSRRYTIRNGESHFLTSGRMRSRTSHIQKVVLAYDTTRLQLVDAPHPFTDRSWPGPRSPVCARLRPVDSDFELLLVGAHLKSGDSGEAVDAPPAATRASECAALVTWLLGGSRHEGGRGGPHADAVVLLGDLNAVRQHPSLHPIERLLPAWTWHRPVFEPDDPHEHWTSFGSRSVIDHTLTSPAATAHVRHAPHVYCFDLDPEFDRDNGADSREHTHWLHRKTDLVVQLDDDSPSELVENLFRVSDHRPVSIDLAL